MKIIESYGIIINKFYLKVIKMKNNKSLAGSLFALFANIIFGFSVIFSKIALSVSHPLIILAVRFTVAFLVMNLLWLFGIIKLNFRNKPLKKLIMMALAQPLFYFILELYGINSTSSVISGIVISLVPVGVIILSSILLKEKPTVMQVICSAVSLAAVAFISILQNDGGKSNLLGILLLFLAVICAAVFNILSRSESAHFSPFEKTYMMFLVGSVGFNIIAIAGLRADFLPLLVSAVSQGEFWVAILYLSVLSSTVAYMLYNYSTSLISSVKASSFSNITTVVSVFAGIFIMKERLSVLQLVCCVFIILGVWGVNIQKEKK